MIVCHAPNNFNNNPYFHAIGLRKYGVKSYLLMPTNVGPLNETMWYGYSKMGNPYNIPMIYYSDTQSLVRQLASLAKEQLEVLHLYGGGRYWHAIYAKLVGAKIIRQFFGSDLRNIKKRRQLAFTMLSEDGIILSELELYNKLVWPGAKERTAKIPLAVDPVMYQTPALNTEEKIVFMPTRHDNFKRTTLAFKAWEKLRNIDREAKLVTVNWGENLPELKRIYGDDPRIEWRPLLSRQEFIEMMTKASVVWGQFGGAAHGAIELEAMAAKRPVFANLTSEASKLYWSPPIMQANDPDTLAFKTKLLLNDEDERENVVQEAYQWVREVHDLEKIAGRIYECYRKALEQKK